MYATQDVDAAKAFINNVLVAKKSRGRWSISQALLDEVNRYVDDENAKPNRTKALTMTAIVEAGLIAFFESDEVKRRDLLSAATGVRPMTALGKKMADVLGVQESNEDRPAPKRKVGGRH